MNAGPTRSAIGNATGAHDSNAAAASSSLACTSGRHASAHATPTRRPPAAGSETSGASARISSTQPATSRAIGPAWSNDGASGKTPSIGTTPKPGLKPTTPQHAAGIRIEPPVSVPSAPSTRPSASAAADPPLDPPAVRPGNDGFGTTP